MIARIHAMQRRLQYMKQEESSIFENGPLTIDFASNIAYLNQKELHEKKKKIKLML